MMLLGVSPGGKEAGTMIPKHPREHVPEDYAEVFTDYWDYVQHLVRKAGIEEESVEDVSQDLLVRFMGPYVCKVHRSPKTKHKKRCWVDPDSGRRYDCSPDGFLPKYDPGMQHQLPGMESPKTASFVGMLRGFINTYVRQALDKQMLKRKREPVSTDQLAEAQTLWIEVYAATPDEFKGAEDAQDYRLLVREVITRLEAVPKRGPQLAAMFDEIVRQVEDDGKVDRRALMSTMGVADTTIGMWMRDLRYTLAGMGLANESYLDQLLEDLGYEPA